ncbi:helix-turn-helix transcriptional regulator [Glaesserella parasuis]|uniref:helix-turn-helix transcriptional regulator n=1 Tax=Glaesserella parasuis TaxID=738 RepID=UPI00131064BC|nr:helix-turn-helix transcriptional regulator [Glaesserella parasuis]MCT8548666.1 helix-turn-helix domain-containing protein [Glaesserella parasuis]MDG6346955.1 helix-turn-helix transcriptional regulator [Glaesserella parasuis]MDG6474790.1 helix-turn-helix transcriptional regulator [Glaesserella parasuis]MDG6875512.1 helix-turn-helix transcriptional regulator [Glaesserella parasuis]MDO9800189.1 helix-turn-helix transcriptional regulator [Glaesserella parasuis]
MNNLAKVRESVGITQKQLADQLGFGQPRIANYETGSRTPSLADARRIVSALNKFGATTSLDDVFPVGS